jgi:hypothetical protein
MDYVNVADCFSLVEMELLSESQIQQALECRLKVWTRLLKGEQERWGSIENLLQVYRTSSNKDLTVLKGVSRIRDEWDGKEQQYYYEFCVSRGRE